MHRPRRGRLSYVPLRPDGSATGTPRSIEAPPSAVVATIDLATDPDGAGILWQQVTGPGGEAATLEFLCPRVP